MIDTLKMMLAYKEWANAITYEVVTGLPPGEAERLRATRWESISYTLSHVLAVDDIFRCHLLGIPHAYEVRNFEAPMPLAELRERQCEMDAWYCGLATELREGSLEDVIEFEFVGGGPGAMRRADILLHVVNHGTYHRGLISDMLCHVPADMPANDLTISFARRGRHEWSMVPGRIDRPARHRGMRGAPNVPAEALPVPPARGGEAKHQAHTRTIAPMRAACERLTGPMRSVWIDCPGQGEHGLTRHQGCLQLPGNRGTYRRHEANGPIGVG